MNKKEIPDGLVARAFAYGQDILEGRPGGKMYIRGAHVVGGENRVGDPSDWCKDMRERVREKLGVTLRVRNGRDGGTPIQIRDPRLAYLNSRRNMDGVREVIKSQISAMRRILNDDTFRRIAMRALSAAETGKTFSLRAEDRWTIPIMVYDDEYRRTEDREIETIGPDGQIVKVRELLERLFNQKGLRVKFGEAIYKPATTAKTEKAA